MFILLYEREPSFIYFPPLKETSRAITADHFINIYHTLFHSHVANGIILRGYALACKVILLLQKRRELQLLSSANRLEHCKNLLESLRIFNKYIFNSLNCMQQTVVFYQQSHSQHQKTILCKI